MIKISDILAQIPEHTFYGNADRQIEGIINFDPENENPGVLMWVNAANLPKSDDLKQGTLICGQLPTNPSSDCNYIVVSNPRSVFKQILETFFTSPRKTGIASTAIIHPTAIIGRDAYIGEYVIIEEHCTIGDHVSIGHHTVIMGGTEIGDRVVIGSHNTIGGVGFGYEKDPEGNYSLIPHLGNVTIGNAVEIGNNTCIDRAVMGSTVLSDHVKVDNLVHLAHGVQIGKNSLIIANAMVAGSVHVGEDVWVAPSSSIINKCTIGDQSTIGMGAVVLKPVKNQDTIIGNPGKPLIKKESK